MAVISIVPPRRVQVPEQMMGDGDRIPIIGFITRNGTKKIGQGLTRIVLSLID